MTGERGGLRSAIEGLLRTCADLDEQSAQAGRAARDEARAVASELAGLRIPGMDALADEIAGIGTHMDADVTRSLADARRPYVVEIHELLGLLAPLHGHRPVPALPSSLDVGGVGGIWELFPAGFARDYVGDVAGAVRGSDTVVRDKAGRVAAVPRDEAISTIGATATAFAEAHRDKVERLLSDVECHAVQRHGPQVSDEAQLARLVWQKDPAGAESWRIQPDGVVASKHGCGAVSGGFTSPEALAKPIGAVLRAADRAGGLDGFLDRASGYEETGAIRFGLHVSAESAGLVAGDASGYRGAGTGTRETRKDWIAMRKHSMKHGGEPVFGLPFDPIGEGTDPGATVVFQRLKDGWHLLTCYPVDKHDPRNERLEDVT